MKTSIVFVCSPDFRKMLFLCLRSLLHSGTTFDEIVIYVVGYPKKIKKWEITDPRITIKFVKDIGINGYWGTNKLHLCDTESDRVIYIDTDTIVLNSIDPLYENKKEDLIARDAVRTYQKSWKNQKWLSTLKSMELPHYPLFSPGFMIFQNNSHRKIKDDWYRYTDEILKGTTPFNPSRFAELEAFSLAVSKNQLSYSKMPISGHKYAMIGEDYSDAIVYHLGTPSFYKLYLDIEKEVGLKSIKSTIKRPLLLFLTHKVHRLFYRLKIVLKGARDKRVEY